jgi:DNA-binding transcriptional ArsR family regulator
MAEHHRVGLAIIDSLTIGAFSADVKDGREVLTLLKGINPLGTILAIDHLAKAREETGFVDQGPYGSVFKSNIARSTILMKKGDTPGIVVLEAKKANFSELSPRTLLRQEFEGNCVRYTLADPGECITDQRPLDQVVTSLSKHLEGAKPIQVAEDIDMAEKTVRNHLTALKRSGRVESMGDGRWRAIPEFPDTIAPGIREPDEDTEWSDPDDRPESSGIAECLRIAA